MLEYVVRPFQSPGAHGSIVIPSTPSGSRERATLQWSADATLPATAFSGVDFHCCKEDGAELKRDTETVRIYGNDPENWIDVARSNKLYMNKQTDKSGCFDDPKSSFQDPGGFLQSGFSDTPGASSSKEKCDVTLSLNNNTAQG
jgi:hypothetical protein